MLRIITRKSPLATWQARHVRACLLENHPQLQVTIQGISTEADRFLDRDVAAMGGKGAFVKELEQALLDGAADLAVHSVKDLAVAMPAGLILAAVLPRADPRDVLVSRRYKSLNALPGGARVGTSSLRRQCQLNARYPGLTLLGLRGNLGARLRKLDNGDYDALILAAAGLTRLGKQDRISAYIDIDDVLPAIGQGALGIQTRTDDPRARRFVRDLDDTQTHLCVGAERSFARRLGGGCHLPVAAYAQLRAGQLSLTALVGYTDGSRIEKNSVSGPVDQSEELADALAECLLQQGAGEILGNVTG